MILAIHFLLGFISSFLGTITPSMLNMNAVKISIQKNKKEALKFAAGVSIIVLLQAYVAILFTKYLRENPTFVESLQKIAAFIFIFLSIYFYFQYKKDKTQSKTKEITSKNSFATGLFLSTLNMFSIPFYCGVTTVFDVAGWLQLNQNNIILFVIGSALGTFVLLNLYAKYAKTIKEKSGVFAKKINLVLSVLTGTLAFITMIKFII